MDVVDLRHCVTALHALAEQARQAAGQAASGADADWQSLAAARFREALAQEADRAGRCARLLDDAADALAAHARAVAGAGVAQAAAGAGVAW
jgi:uncharacterized protein YukE